MGVNRPYIRRWVPIVTVLLGALSIHALDGQFATREGHQVEWSINDGLLEVTMTVRSPTVSWIGIGVSPTGAMLGSDAFIGMVGSRRVYRVLLAHSGPEATVFADTATRYTDASVKTTDVGTTVMTVRRPLDADSASQVAIDPSGTTNLILAWRTDPLPPQQLGKHNGFHQEVIGVPKAKPLIKARASVSDPPQKGTVRLSDTMVLTYSFETSTDMVTFKVVGNRPAWLAIGFSPSGRMDGSWTAICNLDQKRVDVRVLGPWRLGSNQPDLAIDIEDSSCTLNGRDVTMEFARPLKLNEAQNPAFDIAPDGQSLVIWAMGNTQTVSQHDHDNRGQRRIDWKSGRSSTVQVDDSPARKAHGSLMMIAWTVLVPVAVCIARFFKDDDRRWFMWHRGLMSLAVVMSMTGLFIIITSVPSGNHFKSLHSVFGLVIQIVTLLQPIIAIFRNTRRALWEKQHRWTAAGLYFFACMNCLLGSILLSSKANGTAFFVLTVIAVFIGIAVFAVLHLRRGKAPPHQAQKDIQGDTRPTRPLDHVDSDDEGLDLSGAQQPWPKDSVNTVDGF
ncbi:Cytochrome b561 domain-containing protein [Plasmodiophora brassicae]